jgi:hypothetical protein
VIGLEVYSTVSPTRNLCVRSAGPGIAIAFAGDTIADGTRSGDAIAAGMATSGVAAAGLVTAGVLASDTVAADLVAADLMAADVLAEDLAAADLVAADRVAADLVAADRVVVAAGGTFLAVGRRTGFVAEALFVASDLPEIRRLAALRAT